MEFVHWFDDVSPDEGTCRGYKTLPSSAVTQTGAYTHATAYCFTESTFTLTLTLTRPLAAPAPAVQSDYTPLLLALFTARTKIADELIDAGAKLEVTTLLHQSSTDEDVTEALGQTDKVSKIEGAIEVNKEKLEADDDVRRVKGEVRLRE